MKAKNAEHFYGRRAGGWIEETDTGAGDRLADFRRNRVREAGKGNWPEHSIEEWRRRSAKGDPHAGAVLDADRSAREAGLGRYAAPKPEKGRRR